MTLEAAVDALGEVAEGVVSAGAARRARCGPGRRAADLRAGGSHGRRRRDARRGPRLAHLEARSRGVRRRIDPPWVRSRTTSRRRQVRAGASRCRARVARAAPRRTRGPGRAGRPPNLAVRGPRPSPAASRGLNTRSSVEPVDDLEARDLGAPATPSAAARVLAPAATCRRRDARGGPARRRTAPTGRRRRARPRSWPRSVAPTSCSPSTGVMGPAGIGRSAMPRRESIPVARSSGEASSWPAPSSMAVTSYSWSPACATVSRPAWTKRRDGKVGSPNSSGRPSAVEAARDGPEGALGHRRRRRGDGREVHTQPVVPRGVHERGAHADARARRRRPGRSVMTRTSFEPTRCWCTASTWSGQHVGGRHDRRRADGAALGHDHVDR